ncbi:hypothetical protein [Sphingomonas oligophenolica]|uniref:Uncharacterized protein n=1 Tax=Sphingomonas oligophenolica TaxID=301154 RepID=A0A502CII3_9SPHN|nr:hypothetical protein [Sphingomonas oligophenolica]TPG12623.1 hypothetical protein EAH84_07485 [Sphingomonas oligophenolica]
MTPALSIVIDRYLRAHDMPETLFGRRAVNDPRLVSDLRRGRQVGERVRRRIELFMRENHA